MKNNSKKDFIWNFLGLTINSFNSLFFLIIVNWINGKNDGGIFTFAFSLCGLTYFIGTYFNRTYQISNPNKFSNKEFICNRLLSILFMCILTISYAVIMKYNMYKFSIIFGLCLYKMLESLAEAMYGIETENNELYKSGISMFMKGISSIFLFLVIDIFTSKMLLSVISIVIMNLLFIIIYDIPNCKKYISTSFDYKNVLKIFKFAFPIFIFSFLNNYIINAAKYTLDYYDTASIQNIFGIILMPGTVMGLCTGYILNPYLLELKNHYINKEYKELKSILYKILKMIVGLGLFTLICAFIFGIPLLNLVYNIKLDSYKYQMLMIIAGSVFLAITIIYSNALTIMNKNRIQMYLYICNSIISLISSIVLVKHFGIFGASLTYTIIMFAQGVEFFGLFNFFYKKMEVIK